MPDTKEENSWQFQLALEWLQMTNGNINAAKDRADESIFLIPDRAWQWAIEKYRRLHTGSPHK